MGNNKLAIIIPAYKPNYLEKVLHSLAAQTDKRFNTYIGDDCSPFDIKAIVDRYASILDISYTRFGYNLGKGNLVSHWNRCIGLIEEEPYFCLFSDDDIMGSGCIASFYRTLAEFPEHDVYHFDIDIINEDESIQKKCNPFPALMSSGKFFLDLYQEKIDARMPEFIFRTSHFKDCGGFVEFKKAYRSDNATVMACALLNGIRTIPGKDAKILWRDSGINISSSRSLSDIRTFSEANIDFFNWAHRFYRSNNTRYPLPLQTEKKAILGMIKFLLPHSGFRESYGNLKRYRPHAPAYRLPIMSSFIVHAMKQARRYRNNGLH